MDDALIARYDRRLPRYTSYPTAPHFSAAVDGVRYGDWLDALPASEPLSLYLHIPFCDTLCWFCGCHTKVVNRYGPVAAYAADLVREIELVVDRLGARRPVRHIHFGGGSPTILEPQDIARLGELLRTRFAIEEDAEIAVEIDPRGLEDATVGALAEIGVNRVSLGLQDINPEVQRAINRIQTPAQNRDVVAMVRAAGIPGVNLDLMYGLPHQSLERLLATVDHALTLRPDRIALFGYAHVPAMKRHQRLIPEAALPGAAERFAQAEAASRRLVAAGYRRIGLDHFARPGDAMATTAAAGRLKRNFQGYSTDRAQTLLGFGASAIGTLPQGYVQNAADVVAWREAVRKGELPVVRGAELSADDRRRRDIINALMCDLAVDLDGFGAGQERAALETMARDGLVELRGKTLRVTERGRPLVRNVAAVFDTYLDPDGSRHSRAI